MKRLDDLLKQRSLNDTGFDNSTGNTSGRILRKDGRGNIIKTGIPFLHRISLFHTLINMSLMHFILFTLLVFLIINIFFAFIYYQIGPQHLDIDVQHMSSWEAFLSCFFFSSQTVMTVGYGGMHPLNLSSNIVAAVESFVGWMGFAVLTGLMYSRFSKPRAYLLFSKHALIAPFKQGKALMFRVAPYKNNTLTDAEVLLNVAFKVQEEGKVINKFFPLKTEMGKINALPLNWTIVHHIDENSPLFDMTMADFEKNEIEIMVFFKAFDEHFSNIVQQRMSYIANEIIFGAKFIQMFRQHESKQSTVLELNKLDAYERVNI